MPLTVWWDWRSWLARQVVALKAVGSNPISHPKKNTENSVLGIFLSNPKDWHGITPKACMESPRAYGITRQRVFPLRRDTKRSICSFFVLPLTNCLKDAIIRLLNYVLRLYKQ